MEEGCYGDKCEAHDLDFDYFGGHTKAVKGFAYVNQRHLRVRLKSNLRRSKFTYFRRAYTIQGAELYDMGQIKLGKYPVHYHMCNETLRDGSRSSVRANAIRRTYNRCVTVHGSHGVEVRDNVAYDNRGHCFFLEDGGEHDTWIEGNLGIGTRFESMV